MLSQQLLRLPVWGVYTGVVGENGGLRHRRTWLRGGTERLSCSTSRTTLRPSTFGQWVASSPKSWAARPSCRARTIRTSSTSSSRSAPPYHSPQTCPLSPPRLNSTSSSSCATSSVSAYACVCVRLCVRGGGGGASNFLWAPWCVGACMYVYVWVCARH